MPPAVRTVVVAEDRRYVRALARLVAVEPAVRLCGAAQDAETAAMVARAVRAELLLIDARLPGIAEAAWPRGARKILLVDHESAPSTAGARASVTDACIAMDRLADELPELMRRLFP